MWKILAAALAAIALAGCGDLNEARVPMADAAADGSGRQFLPPPPGKASLYVFRVGKPQPIIWTITAGRETLAQIGTTSWARLEMPPGQVDLRCSGSMADTTSLLLNLRAGETRYIEITEEHFRIICNMAEVPAATGQAGVLTGRRVREL